MSTAAPKSSASNDKGKTSPKVQKVEKEYGKGKSTATLEDLSKYLKSIGYDSLADLLTPAQ